MNDLKVILGVSGGLDSMVLLDVLREVSTPLRLSLLAVYVHHGPANDKDLQLYRDQAKKLLSQTCNRWSVPFASPPAPKKMLNSEEDFRKFRHDRLKDALRKQKARWIALGHNSNDVLETRLLHLIRGCGETGVQAFSLADPPFLRPFVSVSREELARYGKSRKLSWLEDPGNQDQRFFRNWMRQNWLPELERTRPGGVSALARSLSHIASGLKAPDFFSSLILEKGNKRDALLELSSPLKKRVVAVYMRKREMKNYGLSHIEEILKHLERKQKRFTLKLAGRTWDITEKFVSVRED